MSRLTAASEIEQGYSRRHPDLLRHAPGLEPRDGFVLLSVPAPPRRARALLRLAATLSLGGERLLWIDPLEHEAVSGIGAAAEISAAGPDRFAEIERQAARLFERLGRIAGCPAPEPVRLFGGFAFQPGHSSGPPWKRFGESRFVLPSLCYRESPRGASLTLAVDLSRVGPHGRHRVPSLLGLPGLGELSDALWRQAPDDADEPRANSTLVSAEHEEQSLLCRVSRARQDIASGRLDKVVIFRTTHLTFDAPLDVVTVLARLGRQDPACTLFAFGWHDLSFIGATPERLIGKRGLRIHTEAVAGSASAALGSAATRLLESSKDRAEHQLVVDDLLRALGPLCESLSQGERPRVRALRHVVHLHTPLEGVLRQPRHVLRLVERLHPTPAVGGSPTTEALAWLERNEPTKRGWYAAPVGWFDAEGNGQFAMALRSALVESERAHLFAGAGIVRASDEQSELDETRVKLRSVLAALGVDP